MVKKSAENWRMAEAYKGACGRQQARELQYLEEIKKKDQLTVKFEEQTTLLRSQARSIQAQLDHQKNRAETLANQLTGYELQICDDDYNVKTECI